MNRATANISIALCLLMLCACTAMPQKLSPKLRALTEPNPRTTKTITELRTEGDEQEFIVQANARMAKDDEDKARIRALLEPKRSWWKRLWGGGPAGGGR